jgi:putative FmdB family regulatory protein
MPLYSYKCNKCNEITEALQKFSDDPLTICEKCNSIDSLEKIISNTSFRLKGKDWFRRTTSFD